MSGRLHQKARHEMSLDSHHKLNQILCQTSPSSLTSPEHDAIYDFAAAVMSMADRHCTNDYLTVNELRTFLTRTRFEPFMKWVTQPQTFMHFDENKDGTLSFQELHRAVAAYMIPGDSSHCEQSDGTMRADSRLLYVNKKLSHHFHEKNKKIEALQSQLSRVPEILKAQRAHTTNALQERDTARAELAYARNEAEELRGMLDRVKLAREYHSTAREVADRAMELAVMVNQEADQEKLKLQQAVQQLASENDRLRQLCHENDIDI